MERLGILLGKSSRKAGNTGGTELYRMIRMLDQSPEVSFLLDSEHRIIYTNPAWDLFAEANGAPQLAGETAVGSNFFD